MQIDATFTPPPPGYAVYQAKPWPFPELGLSYEGFGFSSFQVVPLWVEETRQFSAGPAGNWSLLTDARDKLIALQPNDGIDVNIKMNWLVHAGSGVTCMWTGDKKIDWKETTDYRAGCQLWGNQLFAATVETSSVKTKLGVKKCRKVLPFRKEDWNKDPNQYPWLFPWCGITGPKGGYRDLIFDRGKIRVPHMVLDPRDYKFTGTKVPAAFWIPVDWCLQA